MTVRNIPACMSDAPLEVVEAAREIARRSRKVLRKVIAETFPNADKATLNDFTQAICQMMAEEVQR